MDIEWWVAIIAALQAAIAVLQAVQSYYSLQSAKDIWTLKKKMDFLLWDQTRPSNNYREIA